MTHIQLRPEPHISSYDVLFLPGTELAFFIKEIFAASTPDPSVKGVDPILGGNISKPSVYPKHTCPRWEDLVSYEGYRLAISEVVLNGLTGLSWEYRAKPREYLYVFPDRSGMFRVVHPGVCAYESRSTTGNGVPEVQGRELCEEINRRLTKYGVAFYVRAAT